MPKEKSTEKIDLINPSQKKAFSDTAVNKESSSFSARNKEESLSVLSLVSPNDTVPAIVAWAVKMVHAVDADVRAILL